MQKLYFHISKLTFLENSFIQVKIYSLFFYIIADSWLRNI